MPSNASAGRIETQDIDEHRQVLQPWDLILRQMSPGRFGGRMEYVQVNGILCYREHWTHRVIGTGQTPGGFFLFGGSSSPGTQIDWCGAEIHPGRLAYGRSSTEVDFVIPDGSEHVALLVPEDLLRHYLGEEFVEAASLQDCHRLGCDSRLSYELVRMMHRLIDDFLAQPELLTDERICNAIEWQLLGTLVQVLHDSNRSARRISPRKRRMAFLRAIEYGEALCQPIAVPELAAAAGVSQRSLELAFRETLNVTPVRYLRWNRMNGAQRDLLAAEAGAASVKGVATDWGLVDMGRFAVEYKHLFGESPSETLRRSTRPLPKRLADVLRA